MTLAALAPPAVPAPAKLLLTFAEAAKLLNLSRSLLYEMAADGRLGPTPLAFGRKSLLPAKQLAAWVDAGCPSHNAWLRLAGGGR